jgi:hypothetical protein
VAKWSSALVICLLVAVTLWNYLDDKGLIPNWVSHLSARLVMYGAVGVWFVYKLARLGVLKDMLPFTWSKNAWTTKEAVRDERIYRRITDDRWIRWP